MLYEIGAKLHVRTIATEIIRQRPERQAYLLAFGISLRHQGPEPAWPYVKRLDDKASLRADGAACRPTPELRCV